MDAQVLFRLFHTKIIQSTTAITSIAIALKRIDYKSNANLIFRHTERNEV